MKQEYREAFTEVYEIFGLMPNSLLKKIPKKFYEMIENERTKEYQPNIKEPLEQQKLKNETIILLGLIYRDFLCSAEEKKILQEKDAKELQRVQDEIEKELREKYNPDNLFKKKNISTEETVATTEETSMTVVQEQKWYQKIFNIIKSIFHRN